MNSHLNRHPSSHLSDTWSMLTNPCSIITWDGLVVMVSNFMLIVFNHMTHVRPFGLLYSRSRLYMLSSSSQPRCFACVNLAYTRCMWTLESITPDHHVVSRNEELSQWCTVRENTISSWNFSERSPHNATVVLSKIRCIKGLTSHAIHKVTWYGHHHVLLDLHHQSTGTIFLSLAPHHDLHQRVAIGVVVLLMLLLLKLHPSKIVNASASTNISIKTTLWLLPVVVPSTCKSILSITTWSSHTSNISHHIVGHITSQAYPAKTS